MTLQEDLREKLPGGHVVALDLSTEDAVKPGNPYCRYRTEDGHRTYCSADLWEHAKTKFVIPSGGKIPRQHVVCEQCGNNSYRTLDNECGRCGCPMFDCPACGKAVHGKVDACPHCDAGYEW